MKLPKIEYTKQRGGRYHLNIPIPAEIRQLYNSKAAFERTTGTSDPAEAKRQVTDQRAIMERQRREAQTKADKARLKSLLDPADAEIVNALGGADQLPTLIAELRKTSAFLEAGRGATEPATFDVDMVRSNVVGLSGKPIKGPIPQAVHIDAEGIAPDVLQDIARGAEEAAHRAYTDHVNAHIRKHKATAAILSTPIPTAPDWATEGVTGLRELADRYADDKQYTKQNRDALLYTVRRWIELHGDMPIAKFERRHLSEFSDALKGLPTTRKKSVQDLSIREAIALAKAEGLETMGDKIRATRVDHMKWMLAHAVNQLGTIPADPFAGFNIVKSKVKHSAQAKDNSKPFSPAQIRAILPHCKNKFHPDTLDHWAPAIAAYTAARREEIGQLTVCDVKDWGNGLTITITDEGEDQTVKNRHSFRTIPVPPALLEAGFCDFVARRRQAGGKMLFMENYTDNKTKSQTLREVKPSTRGRFTETYGEGFTRSVRKPLKLTETGYKFHSFRHSWTDAARRAKIDPEIRRLIAGRLDDSGVKNDATESAYGGADLLQEKLDAMIAVTPFLTLDG